jgi:hypothetical protein
MGSGESTTRCVASPCYDRLLHRPQVAPGLCRTRPISPLFSPGDRFTDSSVHRTSWSNCWHSCFVFRRSPVQIPAWWSAIKAEIFVVFFSLLRQICLCALKIDYNRFLPYPSSSSFTGSPTTRHCVICSQFRSHKSKYHSKCHGRAAWSPGLWRHVVLQVVSNVSEETVDSIFRVYWIKLGYRSVI